MSRVQLALNVDNLDRAVAFYSTLFDTEPAKIRPGYANFAIDEPPLKLVLIEDATRTPGSLNHLGVEVATSQDVAAAHRRLTTQGLPTAVENQTECCYALQDKVWVDGPGGEPWEIYTVLGEAEVPPSATGSAEPSSTACCSTRPELTGEDGDAARQALSAHASPGAR